MEFLLNAPSTILVVDDSVPLHQIYTITLMRYKGNIIHALSGEEGLEKLRAHPDVSLLIVDATMPRMSGLEFIKKVREQEAFRTTPIIVVSTRGTDEDSREVLAFAQGVLQKPFTSTELHTVVGKLIEAGVSAPAPPQP